jgi:hypothetical protein
MRIINLLQAKSEERISKKPIMLDPAKVIQRIHSIQKQEFLARKRFRGWNLIEVVYEDLAQDPQKEFRRIGDFLKIYDINISKINLKKQNPEPLAKLIKNFDEVTDGLKETPFAYCLEN